MFRRKRIVSVAVLVLLFVQAAAFGASWGVRSYLVGQSHTPGERKGQVMLGVRMDNPVSLGDADGVYVPMLFSEHGSLYAATDQVHLDVDEFSATASWAAVGTDTAALTVSTTHVPSHDVAASLSLNKSGATIADASYKKTITALDASSLAGTGLVDFYVKTTDLSNISEVFVRIGTDSSNYAQYGIDPEEFSTALWNHVDFSLHNGVQTGTGLDLSSITYVEFGVSMDATQATSAVVLFNALELHSVNASELVVVGNVANTVRVQKFGSPSNATATTDAGDATDGTLRVTLATDDVNAAAILVALQSNVLTSKTILTGSFAGTAVANGSYLEIVADPGDNLAVHIVALSVTQTVQGLVSLWDETGGTPVQVSEGWYFPAYGGIVLVPSSVAYFIATQESENFGLKNETGAACSFAGTVMYYTEDITP
ncbi:MAG TPA: hypothetical protein ENH62_05290 [Marinobacter sp.]|uniref:Uncharacterized protein n=1 Tax=marine sediment metagenome TaxID=412755 RepID=A0A0F9LEI2_9ZZZZ|nr:hypothetical protein [Marinobacter sp.]